MKFRDLGKFVYFCEENQANFGELPDFTPDIRRFSQFQIKGKKVSLFGLSVSVSVIQRTYNFRQAAAPPAVAAAAGRYNENLNRGLATRISLRKFFSFLLSFVI